MYKTSSRWKRSLLFIRKRLKLGRDGTLKETRGNGLALLPLGIFLALFIGSGIITGDFYKLPILVAISIAVGVALAMNRKESFHVKVERFAKGAGNEHYDYGSNFCTGRSIF